MARWFRPFLVLAGILLPGALSPGHPSMTAMASAASSGTGCGLACTACFASAPSIASGSDDPSGGTMHPILRWVNPAPIPGTQSAPKYPRSARKAGIAARLLLFLRIDKEGYVTSMTVGTVKRLSFSSCTEVAAEGPEKAEREVPAAIQGDLADAAAHAVLQWRFRPALRNGEPVTTLQAQILEFCPSLAASH